jgi:hypothetical protein
LSFRCYFHRCFLSLSLSLCGKKIVQYKVLGSDCVWCFLLLPGRGVAEVKDFQALGHRPSPGALTADHVSRSSFSVGRTCFYDLVWLRWGNPGGEEKTQTLCCM